MLHIILLILKIIGIVLLCILGILILSIVCALFVPVRYRIKVTREEGEGKPPFTAYVKITWLLHLVNILVRYPADVILRVRLMFITLFRLPRKNKTDEKQTGETAEAEKKKKNQPKEEKEDRKKQKDEHKEEKEEQIKAQAQPTDGPQNEDESQTDIDTSTLQKNLSESCRDDYVAFESDFAQIDDSADQNQEPDTPESPETEEGAHSQGKFSLISKIKKIIDKIKQIVEKIKAFFENIQYTIQNFCDKIKSVLDNIEYYQQIIESDTFKHSLQLCQKEFKSLYKGMKPDKFEAEITIGMDDPAITGKILAIYGMLYPFIGQNVQIVGDFERTHIEGNIYIRGKIRALTFLRTAIRVYFNKDIKKLIKLLKKEAV